MKKMKLIPELSLFVLFLALFAAGCKSSSNESAGNTITNDTAVTAATCKVEIYNFHRAHRCNSCSAVHDVTKSTIEKFFKTQLDNGVVKFQDINLDDAINAQLAAKFEVKDTGLIILSRINGKEQVEDISDFAFTTAIAEPEMLTEGIKTKVGEKVQ